MEPAGFCLGQAFAAQFGIGRISAAYAELIETITT